MVLTYGNMWTNGYLQVNKLSTVIFDGQGVPVDINNELEDSEWGECIPCSIKVNTRSSKGVYQDGNFQMAQYDILIDVRIFDATRIRLVHHGRHVGDFSVQDIQLVPGVGRTKIIV